VCQETALVNSKSDLGCSVTPLLQEHSCKK